QTAWQAPLYWTIENSEWRIFTMNGLQPLDPAAPVSHLSYFEADAYARWADARLPTEAEWEAVARRQFSALQPLPNLLEGDALQPLPAPSLDATCEIVQLIVDLWEWTASAY